jgi:hypothetical protein
MSENAIKTCNDRTARWHCKYRMLVSTVRRAVKMNSNTTLTTALIRDLSSAINKLRSHLYPYSISTN